MVDAFFTAVQQPPIPKPSVENLGLTKEWLQTTAEAIVQSAKTKEEEDSTYWAIGAGTPSQKALFKSSYADPDFIVKVLPDLFRCCHTDDYPSVTITVTYVDGSSTVVSSHSQSEYMLPWKVEQHGRNADTFNRNISIAVVKLLPTGATNRERISGGDFGVALAGAVMKSIEEQWNSLRAEDKDMVGNLPVDDGADFSKVFGASTVTGMYDRFLFGYDTKVVKYRPLDIKTQFFTDEMVVRIPAWVWDAKDRWGGDNVGRRRLTEHALRVALVTAAVNGDKEITAPCLAAGFRLVEWQERLRAKFRPGLAETKEAECLEAVYHALLEQHQKQKAAGTFPKGADLIGRDGESLWRFLNYTDVVKSRNLYRKYGSMVTRIKNMMVEDGILERVHEIEHEYEENGKQKGEKVGKATPFYWLRKAL